MEASIFRVIIGITVFHFLLEQLLGFLNGSRKQSTLPAEAEGIYDEERYRKWLAYDKARTRLGRISSWLSFAILQVMLWTGGFGWLDRLIRADFTEHEILLPLLFFGVLGAASGIIGLPFSLYSTFRIEAEFGFNRTTAKTFVLDRLKGIALSVVLGGGIGGFVIYLYLLNPTDFWWIAWAFVSGISLLTTMFYTSVFARFFNKLTPLGDGELRTAIEEYAQGVGYAIKHIYVMDGSRRSSKANAYFSGLGPQKSIVLFDTLIENHPVEEIVAVLAHEVGHYKKRHIPVSMMLSVLQTGITFYLLSLLLEIPYFSMALQADSPSFHMGLLVFGLLYSPISLLLGLGMNVLSRKNEFEADAFARATTNAASMIAALKRLASDSLVNLTPHPAATFFYASHPPILKRIAALNR